MIGLTDVTTYFIKILLQNLQQNIFSQMVMLYSVSIAIGQFWCATANMLKRNYFKYSCCMLGSIFAMID